MTTIENLLKKLDGVRVHTAGTGSIYVYYNNLKVRVSDHEPNYGAPNRHNDKCFYLKDIDVTSLTYIMLSKKSLNI